MNRNRLLLLLIGLAATACAPTTDDGFAEADDRAALDGIAFHSIIGQSATEITPGELMVVYLLSDADAPVDQFSRQSFLACDLTNWAIEHTVASYLPNVDLRDIPDADIDPEADVDSDIDIVSAVGFVVALDVRDGPQMVIDPNGFDHTFQLTVEEETL